jgi:proline dehydrogenase
VKPLGLAFRRDLMILIAEEARDLGIRLHFDSPSAELADITLSAADDALRAQGSIGCTLPGRWSRSLSDAEWAIERDLTIRVVKGQWSDPGGPTNDASRGFLAVIDRLAGRARHVAVATHDAALAYEAIGRLQTAGTACELELLMVEPADAAMRIAQAMRTPVRRYIAYGDGDCLYKPVVTRPGRAPLASWPPPSLQSGALAPA